MISVTRSNNGAAIEVVASNLQRMGNEFQTYASQALNDHIRQQEAGAVRGVAAQTGWPGGTIKAGSRIRHSSPGAFMEAAVTFRGGSADAGSKTSRSWGGRSSAGAKHGDWPSYTRKGGMMDHTFQIRSFGAQIYVRRSAMRGPLGRIHMVVPPRELVRQDMPTFPARVAFAAADLEQRVYRRAISAFGF